MRALSPFRPLPTSLLLPLLAFAAVAPPPARAQTFEGTSQVVAVEVPVNVVGRDGEPVRGLTADDFEVYDGNERQKITSFEVVDLKTLEAQAGEATPAPASSRPPVDIPSAARRRFLFLFDLSFSSPTAILKARLAARDFVLHSLHPEDLAAVATYSLENGPKLIITFTPDRAQLARAIDTLGYHRALDAEAKNDPLRFMIEPPATEQLGSAIELEGAGSGSQRNVDIRQQKEQVLYDYLQTIAFAAARSDRSYEVGRISSYSRSLAQVARALNSVQGRKQVLFFSEGFDSRLLLGRNTTDQDAVDDNLSAEFGEIWKVDNDQRFGNTGLQGDLKRMLDEFRRADCVIQAVDIGGLRAGADERARPDGQGALFYIANETGGELFKDANNLREPLDRVLERTSVTYLLTFERSDLKLDGGYHRLRVKALKLPAGAHLAHRTGYYAPRPFKQLDALEKNLLASDGIASATPRREIDLDVLSAAFRATPQRAYVPVIIEAGGKSLLNGHTGKKIDVEFYTYVSDLQGQMRDFFTQRVALDLDKGKSRQALLEGGIKYYGHFDLQPGAYNVRVLVRNAETGRTGVQTMRVTVPTYDQAQPVLLPPFFMEEHQKWLMVREQGANTLQGSVIYPFTVSGEPYVPAARPVLHGPKPARLCLVAYNLGKGAVHVDGKVVAADGKLSPAGKLENVERTATGIQGLDKLVATFDPAGLNAGDYVLKVAVTDPVTGHQQTNSLPFQVER
ncbi:MAG TPA: VWA domain-containing protein [Thermoanaerobaculia bacterium]